MTELGPCHSQQNGPNQHTGTQRPRLHNAEGGIESGYRWQAINRPTSSQGRPGTDIESPIMWNRLHHNPFKDLVGAERCAVGSFILGVSNYYAGN